MTDEDFERIGHDITDALLVGTDVQEHRRGCIGVEDANTLWTEVQRLRQRLGRLRDVSGKAYLVLFATKPFVSDGTIAYLVPATLPELVTIVADLGAALEGS